MFQDLMAKKSVEWDRMMGGQRPEDRTRGFEEFRKLSDEEVDLANRVVSKSMLKDFVGLKIQYFDQLATETDARHRSEGIKKFEQVCDSELALARAAGPRHLLRDDAEADARLAKQRREREDEEETKRLEEQAKRKEMERWNAFGYGMMPPYRMAQQFDSRWRPAMRRHSMADIMPPMGYAYPGREGSFGSMDEYGQFNAPLSPTPLLSDIDQKLKLLAQLEAARAVLHNHPTTSSTSSSDDVKSRLRRINRLQMRVIDEILGSKADLSTDLLSDLEGQRARFDDEDGRHRRTPKGRRSRETRKIILELPDNDDAEAHIITAGAPPLFNNSYQPMCTGTSELCPVRRGGYGYLDSDPNTLCVATTYEKQIIHPDDMPHYHGGGGALPGPSGAYYRPNYATFSVLVPGVFPRGPYFQLKTQCDAGLADAFQVEEHSDIVEPARASDKPTIVSRTTLVVNTREQATDTDGSSAATSTPLQPLQVVQVDPPLPTVPALTADAPLEQAALKPTTTSAERFAQDCQDSLRKIADSVSGLQRTVSSFAAVPPQEIDPSFE